MHTKHEPYSIDLLNYEVLQFLGSLERLTKLPVHRFAGRHVRGCMKRVKSIQKRDRRLRKHGMTLMMFGA